MGPESWISGPWSLVGSPCSGAHVRGSVFGVPWSQVRGPDSVVPDPWSRVCSPGSVVRVLVLGPWFGFDLGPWSRVPVSSLPLMGKLR